MYKVICDRCKNPIDGTTYYTVDIYGHDISPTDDDRLFLTTAAQNLITNVIKAEGLEKHYCALCKDKIEEFLRTEDTTMSLPKEPSSRVLSETFGCKRRNKTKQVLSKIAFHKWLKENI